MAADFIKVRCPVLPRYDGTVRNAGGDVIQFLYGEDGMDGAAVEGQRLEHLKMKEHQFRETFLIDISTSATPPSWLKADDAEHLRSSVEAHKLLESEYQVQHIRAWCASDVSQCTMWREPSLSYLTNKGCCSN